MLYALTQILQEHRSSRESSGHEGKYALARGYRFLLLLFRCSRLGWWGSRRLVRHHSILWGIKPRFLDCELDTADILFHIVTIETSRLCVCWAERDSYECKRGMLQKGADLFGLGSWRRLWMLVRMAATSYVGDQRFWRMSRQSSPVLYTFGWNILERNFT